MKKLKTILHSKYLFVLLILSVIIISVRLIIPKQSIYNKNITEIKGVILKTKIDGAKLTINIKNKEQLIGTYYFKTKNEKDKFNLEIGDKIKIIGKLNQPESNTTENTFNYKKYLLNKNIHYLIKINSYKLISKNTNILLKLKNKITKYLSSNPYLETFILGDKSNVKKEVKQSYQEIGISHLLAISGMHISLLTKIILVILNKLKLNSNKKQYILILIIVLYLLLIGPTPSILRAVIFLILSIINKLYNLDISNRKIFIITTILVLLYNPFYLYEIAFIYSFSISYILIETDISKSNYLVELLKVSLISFLISLPITLYNFYQINLLSIIYNLFYVPLISIIVFPLALLSTFIPLFIPLLNIMTTILESISLLLNNINIGKLIFPKVPTIIYIIEFISSYFIIKNKKVFIPILLVILLFHYNETFISNKSYIKFIDVGQGDSTLLYSNNEATLIDTGGKSTFYEDWEKPNSITTNAEYTTIPLLKSLGIRKIKYLILTHGDTDHLGDADELIENFPVENIILNNNNINNNERKIILKRNDILYGKEGLYLTNGNIKLQQLNKSWYEENDSSQVYIIKYKNKKLLFMGDASKETEKYLLDYYNLNNIDVLKVGHHGSKTSSSKLFLESINPKVSIISVGENNRYHHPNFEVLENLKSVESKYYLTSKKGTITYNLNTNKILFSKNM